jgi:hypothetical protein
MMSCKKRRLFGFVILEHSSAGVLHGVGVQVGVRRLVEDGNFGANGLACVVGLAFEGKKRASEK